MSTPRSYIHDCMMTLPLVVGVVLWSSGTESALRVSVAGLAVGWSLLLSEQAATRFVTAAVNGDDPAAIGALMLKQLVTVPLAALLMVYLGAGAVGAAVVSLGLGAVVHAAVRVTQVHDAQLALGGSLQESGC